MNVRSVVQHGERLATSPPIYFEMKTFFTAGVTSVADEKQKRTEISAEV